EGRASPSYKSYLRCVSLHGAKRVLGNTLRRSRRRHANRRPPSSSLRSRGREFGAYSRSSPASTATASPSACRGPRGPNHKACQGRDVARALSRRSRADGAVAKTPEKRPRAQSPNAAGSRRRDAPPSSARRPDRRRGRAGARGLPEDGRSIETERIASGRSSSFYKDFAQRNPEIIHRSGG